VSGDLVTELVELVAAYHWRWTVVHGCHGMECEMCAGLHERHAWALAAMEAGPDVQPRLEEAVA
jgi:hypothetical protein